MAGVNDSSTQVRFPFGNFPHQLANQLRFEQLGPLLQGLGFNPSNQFQRRLGNAEGPLADVIRFAQGFTPGALQQGQDIGNQIAARGSAAYEQLTQQIGQSLGAAGQGLDYARQFAANAFGPTTDDALYRDASRRLIDQMRPDLAARGLVESGAGAQAESGALRDLAAQFAQGASARQAQAIPLLGGAAQLGPSLAAGQLAAVPQYGQAAQQALALPMQTLGNLLSLLTVGQSGTQNLIQSTGPIAGSESKGLRII